MIIYMCVSVIEYSEEAMLNAVRILAHWCSFQSTAQAYIKGQLQCRPVQEAYLMAR